MVKCPKCGAFSYPELSQCNMCGASLVSAKTPPAPAGPAAQDEQPGLGPSPRSGDAAPAMPAEDEGVGAIGLDGPQNKAEAIQAQALDTRPAAVNLDLEFGRERREDTAPAGTSRSQRQEPWQQEVSDRVLSFRRRRAKLRNDSPADQTLDFEFERGETGAAVEPEAERFLEFPQNGGRFDTEIGRGDALEDDALYMHEETREPSEEVFEIPDAPRPRAEDFELESDRGNRLEIVVDPAESEARTAAPQLEQEAYQVASIGSRFSAGLIDGLLLLLSGGLFAFIFSFAGGRLALVPLNLAVMGVIASIFVWSYFAMFTALASSTPGQSWMGVEARNMEGLPPDRRESLLRAFGYLVSLSAFMLGFFWALVDGESLTWHDRISGTFLTPVKRDVSG